MNDYIDRLYGWISSTDAAFGESLTVEDFEEKLQDEDYATRMYTWIAETDPDFQKQLSLEFFINKVKKRYFFRTFYYYKHRGGWVIGRDSRDRTSTTTWGFYRRRYKLRRD